MALYKKKPVVIEAVEYPYHEWADNPLEFYELPDWLQAAIDDETIRPDFRSEDYWYLVIKTLEGEMTVGPDDYIIQGVEGEIYPCKRSIFDATYEVYSGADPRW